MNDNLINEQIKKANEQVTIHSRIGGSWSGPGASTINAKEVIGIMPYIITKFNIRTIADMPCGDYDWMQHVDLRGADYKGYDVVDFLIKHNKEKHKDVEFVLFNALVEILPKNDLVICRDFLFHLPNELILLVLDNIKKSGSGYLLTTTTKHLPKNRDLSGVYGYRAINLEIEPFCLSNEHMTFQEKGKACGGRSMSLFKIN